MRRNQNRIWIILAALIVCLLSISLPVAASTGEVSTEPQRDPLTSTDVYAGVTVDYMGKLKFLVRNRDTLEPIEGASVELYVESLGSYVLFGMTNSEGIYELDVAYQTEGEDIEGNYEQSDGQIRFRGMIARFASGDIRWRVYKKDYLEYPTSGSLQLDTVTLPHVVEVFLYQEKEGDNPDVTTQPTITSTPNQPERPLPKTGVEYKTKQYLFIAAGFILVAMILGILLYRSRRNEKEQ